MSLYNLNTNQAMSLSLVIIVVGAFIVSIVGLINGNFLPAAKETQIMITKSPTQIIYRGPSEENIITVLHELKDIPFTPYIFNTSTDVTINTTLDKNTPTILDDKTLRLFPEGIILDKELILEHTSLSPKDKD